MISPAKTLCALLTVLLIAQVGFAADVILNEFNAVAKNKYLDGGDYSDEPDKVDQYFGTVPGMPDGRIEGNGGNWLELAVITDNLDMGGWQLRWAEVGASDTDGSDIWYGDSDVEQGILFFSTTASIWSNLRKGTIITISQLKDIDVDTDWDGPDRNFTNNVDPPDVDVVIDLNTDTSYNPTPANPPAGDWWIHISTKGEQDEYDQDNGYDRLIRTVTNVDGDEDGKFSVGDADWELTIVDDQGQTVFGPIGEDAPGWDQGGINDEEIGRMEADPTDLAGIADFDDATTSSFGLPNEYGGDTQDFYSLRVPEPTVLLLIAAAVPAVIRRRRRQR